MSDALTDPPTKENQSELVFEITPIIKKLLLTNYSPKVYPVKSSDGSKEYLVIFARNHISCTCRDWQFRSKTPEGFMKKIPHYCKHQKQLAFKLLNGGC